MDKNSFCDIENLKNESDVEQFFIIQLLSLLGIKKEFIRTKDEIKSYYIGKGKKRKKYKPDYIIVVHGIPILIIEAKSPKEKITAEFINETQLYAHVLNKQYPTDINPVAYCLTSNGKETYLHNWDQEEKILSLKLREIYIGSKKFSSLKKYLSFQVLKKKVLKYFKEIHKDLDLKHFESYLEKIVEEIKPLEEIFIPQKGKIQTPKKPSYKRGWRDITKKEYHKDPISEQKTLLDFFKEHNRLVVLGDSGAGKTTSLERFAYDNAIKILTDGERSRLPVLVAVNIFSKKRDIEDLESYICDLLSISPEKYYQLLILGKLLIMIDGLNETSKIERENIIDDIQDLIKEERFKENQIIVSARSDEYYSYSDIFDLPAVEIMKLDDVSIKDYLNKILKENGEKCFEDLKFYELLDLVRNPLLLSIIAAVYKRGDSKNISNIGMLLKKFVSGMLEWELQKVDRKELKNIIFKIFSFIAYLSIENDDFGKINSNVAEELLKQSYETFSVLEEIKLKDISSSEFQKILLTTGILREKNEFWEFYHQLLQEYLASEELCRRDRLNIMEFEDHLLNTKWLQVVYNAIGILEVSKARNIIKKLIDENIFMAAYLWKYASNSQLDDLEPILILKLTNICDNWKNDEISCMQAVRALGRIGTPKAIQIIVKILNELNDGDFDQRGILMVAAKTAATFQINEAIDWKG